MGELILPCSFHCAMDQLANRETARLRRGKERERPLRDKREATEWANPTAIATFTWPLLGIGRPESLWRLLTLFPPLIPTDADADADADAIFSLFFFFFFFW